MAKKSLPYADASSGQRAYEEIEKILRGFGCTQFGIMNDWQNGAVILQFQYRGRQVSITASWHGYASLWLKAHPWQPRSRRSGKEHEQLARRKGEIAVPSILRDWIKGQTTAVEAGLMPFDHAFMSHMLMPDGTRLIDHAVKLLPAPHE
jgi:hypothetical protein